MLVFSQSQNFAYNERILKKISAHETSCLKQCNSMPRMHHFAAFLFFIKFFRGGGGGHAPGPPSRLGALRRRSSDNTDKICSGLAPLLYVCLSLCLSDHSLLFSSVSLSMSVCLYACLCFYFFYRIKQKARELCLSYTEGQTFQTCCTGVCTAQEQPKIVILI